MSLVHVFTGELAGESNVSEDRVFVTSNAAIVLDGVTAVEASHAGGGGWYADALGRRLVELLNADPAGHLPDLLEKAIWDVGTSAGLVPGRSPASTVAILRWTDAYVDGLVLGDTERAVDAFLITGGGRHGCGTSLGRAHVRARAERYHFWAPPTHRRMTEAATYSAVTMPPVFTDSIISRT